MSRPSIRILARPTAPPTRTGAPGAYGLWDALAVHPGGSTLETGGHGEKTARSNARRLAAQSWGYEFNFRDGEWADVEQHLTACELEAQAEEAGELDERD